MAQDFKAFLKQAASVVPSARQQAWFDTEFYGFVHFGVNAYTGREWGDGKEDPAIFNPVDLDCDQWVAAFKSAGIRGAVLTAKHHDGFCLWPSKYTEHSVKNSPWKNGKGNVVREFTDACRRGGLKVGFYLSPWDRNSALYGTDAYNDYYKAQLTELLTEYGELFIVWFDGACGEGPNGRKQVYDFDGYFELVRKYQPDAVTFGGPDVAWIGNESGTSRFAQWAVIPGELNRHAPVQTGPGPLASEGDLSYMNAMMPDIGSLQNILYSKGLIFAGSEVDMSIRPGWFYHPDEEPHSLERLLKTYYTSVGGNACFHLNVPPMPSGLFDPRDVKRLAELGDYLKDAFGRDLAEGATITRSGGPAQTTFEIELKEESEIRYVVLMENLATGQRVESFVIYLQDQYGRFYDAHYDTTIGHKRICAIHGRGRKHKRLKVFIASARDEVDMRSIQVY